jgi:hypothetical protein
VVLAHPGHAHARLVEVAADDLVAQPVVAEVLHQQDELVPFDVRDEFVVIPEFQFNMRYCLTRNVEFSVGYTFIYYSDAVRPADHIDPRVDPRQITDPTNATPFPAFDFVGNPFWVQGLNLGLEYKF